MNGKVERTVAGGAAWNYTIRMSMRWRVLLAMAGAALFCISCAAIVYTVWPLSSVREQIVIWSNMFRMP